MQEEKIQEVLKTLRGIAKMEEERTPIPSRFWMDKYKQDVPYLLSQLADFEIRINRLQERINQAIKVLELEVEALGAKIDQRS